MSHEWGTGRWNRATIHTITLPLLLPLLCLLCASCERSRAPVPVDSARAAPPRATRPAEGPPATTPEPASWDAAAGSVLLVRGDALDSAYIVFPQYSDSILPDTVNFDLGSLRKTNVALYGHAGDVGSAQIASVAGRPWRAGECIEWPMATLALGDSAASTWSVALLEPAVAPVVLDSIEGLAPLDSARLAADITRLASTLRGDTAHVFRGIPFSVRNAYRFTASTGTPALAADVVRNLNQEAMPLEEHNFIIAERHDASRRYQVVYQDRTAGTEESLITTEVLAAVNFQNPPRTALVLLHEGFETNAYALLERTGKGQWRMRWTSVRTGC